MKREREGSERDGARQEGEQSKNNECGTHIRLIKFNYNNCRKNNKPEGSDKMLGAKD